MRKKRAQLAVSDFLRSSEKDGLPGTSISVMGCESRFNGAVLIAMDVVVATDLECARR